LLYVRNREGFFGQPWNSFDFPNVDFAGVHPAAYGFEVQESEISKIL
jgi:hypothetical protein